MTTREQTVLNEESSKLGFMGSYLRENHPFGWRLEYPFDLVVNPALSYSAQTLSVIGNVRTDLSHLGPLGTYREDCSILAKAEYRLVLEAPPVHVLSSAWFRGVNVLKGIQSDVRTNASSWTWDMPGLDSELSFNLQPPFGPFSNNYMTFTRPVFAPAQRHNTDGVFKNVRPCNDASPWLGGLSEEEVEEVGEVERTGLTLANFPFYDIVGREISVLDSKGLDGSTAAVEFNLCHSSAMGRDHFIGFLENAKVVIPNVRDRLSPEL